MASGADLVLIWACFCCCCLSFAHLGSLKPIAIVDLQAAITRLVSRQLAAAWATWQQALLHSKDKQAKAQRALSYLTNSTLRRAFDWWRSHQQLSLEKHDKLRKALSYFTQGALHRAFDSWRAESGRAAEKQELMRKATNWLLQSGLAKVFGTNSTMPFSSVAQRRRQMRCGQYMRERSVAQVHG